MERINKMKIKKCGICRKKDVEGKPLGSIGEYCSNCIKKIKAHLKGLEMEADLN